jgi:hypothetical protein
MISAAKRRQPIAAGVSPQKVSISEFQSREAATANELLSPLRGSMTCFDPFPVGLRPRLPATAASRLRKMRSFGIHSSGYTTTRKESNETPSIKTL